MNAHFKNKKLLLNQAILKSIPVLPPVMYHWWVQRTKESAVGYCWLLVGMGWWCLLNVASIIRWVALFRCWINRLLNGKFSLHTSQWNSPLIQVLQCPINNICETHIPTSKYFCSHVYFLTLCIIGAWQQQNINYSYYFNHNDTKTLAKKEAHNCSNTTCNL